MARLKYPALLLMIQVTLRLTTQYTSVAVMNVEMYRMLVEETATLSCIA